jgi:hypothetical protein
MIEDMHRRCAGGTGVGLKPWAGLVLLGLEQAHSDARPTGVPSGPLKG